MSDVAGLREHVEKLPFRWEEIRNETRRLHSRAYHHVKRVRASLEEHGLEDADVESLATELQSVDGESGEGDTLQDLRPPVDEPGEPSWEEVTREMKWGGSA